MSFYLKEELRKCPIEKLLEISQTPLKETYIGLKKKKNFQKEKKNDIYLKMISNFSNMLILVLNLFFIYLL